MAPSFAQSAKSRGASCGWKKIGRVVALAAVLSVAIWYRAPQGRRFLIIHADDAGMSESANRATIDAMERGFVSSASVMVPCEGFAEFARFAASHPQFDFGVHLTLNCEVPKRRWGPLCRTEDVPSLIDGRGFFYADPYQTAKSAQTEDVSRELHAQIDRAKRSGIRISHLDHHMFVLYGRPDFLRLYVRLAIEYGLPVRYTRTLPDSHCFDRENKELVEAYWEGLATLESHRVPVLDCILTDWDNVEAHRKRELHMEFLRGIRPGLNELFIHCAYAKGPSVPFAKGREAETAFFMSSEAAERIQRSAAIVTTWKQLASLATETECR
jgi:hypothetical protein